MQGWCHLVLGKSFQGPRAHVFSQLIVVLGYPYKWLSLMAAGTLTLALSADVKCT